ncbi:MAG: hypothetical protein Q8R92_05420 [Deltaproteobacteria bacterium]|nr:hypothetical protein [Deltaproteobacteria bacterium]
MAGKGPLPDPDALRRNKPTIPTTKLPAGGYDGEVPDPAYGLGAEGESWWRWAWSLPQAAAWDDGAVYAASRRAQLEDDLAALDLDGDLDLADLLAGADGEAIKRVEYALATLKKAACGKLAVEKEMRELDKRLGLDPKALAELRWTIVESEEDESRASGTPTATVRHLRPVAAGAVA